MSYITHEKECADLMRKIELAIYNKSANICYCDESLVTINYEKLLKQKKGCNSCRNRAITFVESKYSTDNNTVTENEINNFFKNELQILKQSGAGDVPDWVQYMGGMGGIYSN